MRLVDLDFETASAANLKVCGADAYAQDPTTEVLCLVYHVAEGRWLGTYNWWPGMDDDLPGNNLRALAVDPDTIFVAHNAAFEQAVWKYIMVPDFGFPPIPIERWEDTMATCAWKALPLALGKAAPAAGVRVEKDMEGNRLTLSLSRVNKKTGMYPVRTPEVLDRVTSYCATDVGVEGALRRKIGLLSDESPHERGVWCLDQKINQRGVRLDMDFVRQAQLVVDRATVPLLAEFRDLTGGINPGQVAKVVEWAASQGVELESLRKEYLEDLLGAEEGVDDAGYESLAGCDGEELPDRRAALSQGVRRVLAIRQMLGSASIKKLARMQACVGLDGRARGLLQYHAASTGRWGGRLLQPQNFPRGTLDTKLIDPEMAVDAIMAGDPEYVETMLGAPAIECVASSLRHALVPDPGKLFLVGDFAGIEARIVLALAGQHDKVAMMASGHDVYLDMAAAIYNRRSLTKADMTERQTGKNTVLGCGFQMGAAKFHARYCPDQPVEFAERAIQAYRKEWAPKVPELWYGLDKVALRAVKDGGMQERYGVVYKTEGDWLTATLPSGWQKLWYPKPRLWFDEKFHKEAWKYTAYKGGKVSQVKAFGGLETEHVVSGLARGLLVASMMRVEQAGMPIVLTVHDEIVVEVDEDKADLDLFETLMATPTAWSERIGIPIGVESWSGRRYKK